MNPVEEVFGATLIGTIVTAWLLGLICVLSYQYYQKFPGDSKATKFLVGFVWFISVLNTAVLTSMLYYYLVTSYNTPTNLGSAIWSWTTFIVLEAITATSVQMYYARRVYMLSNSYLITGVVVITSLMQLAFGLGTAGVTVRVKVFANFIPWTWISLLWLGSSAACDFVITVAQIFYLLRNRSEIKQTRKMVVKLLAAILATGALTAVVAIIEVFTFGFLGFNFAHVFLSYPNGSVYVISLLTNLHIRNVIRKEDTRNIFTMESMRFKSGNANTTTRDSSFHPNSTDEASNLPGKDETSFGSSDSPRGKWSSHETEKSFGSGPTAV